MGKEKQVIIIHKFNHDTSVSNTESYMDMAV